MENQIDEMTAAQAIVDGLIREGIKYVFGITGDTVLPLLDALHARQDEITYVTARGEMSATSMADAYSRITGEVACCLFHVGPSVAYSVLGTWSAHKDWVPLLILSANMDRYRLRRNIWHEFDVEGVFSKITKWNDQLVEAKDSRRLLRSALQAAKSGMPGPVHIDLPKDLFNQPVNVSSADLSLKGATHMGIVENAVRPSQAAVDHAVELLASAKSPVIIAGRGVMWARAFDELVAFAETTGIPVVTTETGRGAISEDHALCAGLVGHFGRQTANEITAQADVILGLGTGFLNVNTINWQLIPEDTKVIQVETDPQELGKQYAVELGVHACSGEFLRDVLAAYKAAGHNRDDSATRARIAVLKDRERTLYYDTDLDASPIKSQYITKAIEEVFDEDAIYAIGSGYHTHFANFLTVRKPDQYLWPAGSGTLCYAFAAGLGAKMARPDRQVVVPIGDGDFGMNAQDLETAVRMKLNITVVIYNDVSYGALRIFQKNTYDGRYIGSHYGETDFVKMAEAYGAQGLRAETPAELKAALERARDADVCTVIDARIDEWEPAHRAAEFGEFHKF